MTFSHLMIVGFLIGVFLAAMQVSFTSVLLFGIAYAVTAAFITRER